MGGGEDTSHQSLAGSLPPPPTSLPLQPSLQEEQRECLMFPLILVQNEQPPVAQRGNELYCMLMTVYNILLLGRQVTYQLLQSVFGLGLIRYARPRRMGAGEGGLQSTCHTQDSGIQSQETPTEAVEAPYVNPSHLPHQAFTFRQRGQRGDGVRTLA